MEDVKKFHSCTVVICANVGEPKNKTKKQTENEIFRKTKVIFRNKQKKVKNDTKF